MKKSISIIALSWAILFAQPGMKNQAVRAIRLENLKQNYLGETIRFLGAGSISVQGILLDVTENSFIISEHGTPVPHSHANVGVIFIDPNFNDILMVFGLGILGGAAGYLGIIIGHPNPDANMKGVISSLGAGLAGLVGFRAFYKPIKIDISGKTRE